MRNIPILVLGATMTGIAMALSMPDEVLIVERSMLLGGEFIGSLNIKPCCPDHLKAALAVDFKDELIRRNLLNSSGEFHAPRISSVLAGRISQRNVNIMLLTEVISVKSHAEGFEVVLYNADGMISVKTGQIIDTTSTGAFRYANTTYPFRRSLCAMLDANVTTSSLCVPEGDDDAVIMKGRFQSEFVLKVAIQKVDVQKEAKDGNNLRLNTRVSSDVYANDDWLHARAYLNTYWQKNRLSYLSNYNIVSIASNFAYDLNMADADHFSSDIIDKWKWIPSAGYADMLCAFEGGVVICAAIIS